MPPDVEESSATATAAAAAVVAVPRPEEAYAAQWCDNSGDPGAQPGALLERHAVTAHGDVCRDPGDAFGWYFCPRGCASIPGEPPFCAAPALPTASSDLVPCRVPSPPLPPTPEPAGRITNGVSSSDGSAGSGGVFGWSRGESAVQACDFSDDPERRDGAVLERHTLEQGHGDVCRNAPGSAALLLRGARLGRWDPEGRSQSDFFCPRGCGRSAQAPFCTVATSGGGGGRGGGGDDGRAVGPCRVPMPVMSDWDRLSLRLAELEKTKGRAELEGAQRLRSVEQQIKLVKFERRRAKASLV